MTNFTYNKGSDKEENLINTLFKLYYPYWPLLLVIFIVCLAIACAYIQYKTPIYEVSATLMIKDENKGVGKRDQGDPVRGFHEKGCGYVRLVCSSF